MESLATRHSAVSAFTETVEFLERSNAYNAYEILLQHDWLLLFSRHNRFAETHSYLQLSYQITDRLLAAGNKAMRQSRLLLDDNRDISEACGTRPLVRDCIRTRIVHYFH